MTSGYRTTQPERWPSDDLPLQSHLSRIQAYLRGCNLLVFPSTESPLRRQLADFMEQRIEETSRRWMEAVGPAFRLDERARHEVHEDIREAQSRWIAHIRNPDDSATYAYLRDHARGGFISHFPASRFLAGQIKIRQIVSDLLRSELRAQQTLPELLALLDQEFFERILHITDFFVEAREKLLAEQAESYRRSVDSAPAPMFLVNAADSRVIGTNRAADKAVGSARALAVGRELWELHPRAEHEVIREMLAETLHKGAAARENLHLQRDGDAPLPVDVRTSLIEYGSNRMVQTIYMDLSERRRLEAELIQSEKMAAIGQLAAGIAHEIRNPLGIIKNALYDLAEILVDPNSDVQEDLQIANAEIDRAQETISNLLEFSRDSRAEREAVDLNDLVARTLRLMQKYLQNNRVRPIVTATAIPPVRVNQNGIRQVLLNLITNAVQAMPEGGELRTATQIAAPGWVRLRVSDTGVGIPAKTLGYIFNPFFTTKSPGEGTGLGLSVVHNVVSNAGGRISVSSAPGAGSSFTIELPADGSESASSLNRPPASTNDALHTNRDPEPR